MAGRDGTGAPAEMPCLRGVTAPYGEGDSSSRRADVTLEGVHGMLTHDRLVRRHRFATAAVTVLLALGVGFVTDTAIAASPAPTAAPAAVAVGVSTPTVSPAGQVPTATWWQNLCNRSRYRLPWLRQGNRGYYVSVLQLSLKLLGFYSKRVDGYFGPITYSGVRRFQRAARIVVDGRVGPQTWGRLQYYLCD